MLDVISPEHKFINGGSPYITSQLCKDELRPIQNPNMLQSLFKSVGPHAIRSPLSNQSSYALHV